MSYQNGLNLALILTDFIFRETPSILTKQPRTLDWTKDSERTYRLLDWTHGMCSISQIAYEGQL